MNHSKIEFLIICFFCFFSSFIGKMFNDIEILLKPAFYPNAFQYEIKSILMLHYIVESFVTINVFAKVNNSQYFYVDLWLLCKLSACFKKFIIETTSNYNAYEKKKKWWYKETTTKNKRLRKMRTNTGRKNQLYYMKTIYSMWNILLFNQFKRGVWITFW